MKRLFLALGLMAMGTAPSMAQPACPADFQNQSSAMTCRCAPEAALSGSVWGSDTYTTDSRVCRAATHAGAIPATGGTVTVTPAPGLQAYVGSVANGITTSNYGPWPESFTVAAAGATPTACPATFEGQSAPLSCTCATEAILSGAVWGTGTYTADSQLCRAAVHAGVIPTTGGLVHIQPAPGQQAYAGSAANGITTSDYGPWQDSFTFRAPGTK